MSSAFYFIFLFLARFDQKSPKMHNIIEKRKQSILGRPFYMKIHRVKNGDTVYSIAKEYAVYPGKIIEANELINPDRLTVGQELLILTPTRTHTVRGGENLKSISFRFGVSEGELYAKNPSLMGNKSLYPGQVLTIKSDTPPYGMAFSHGYYYKGTPSEALARALPYLSYVTVCAAKADDDDVKLLFDDRAVVKLVRDAGKIPLLQIYSDTKCPYLENEVCDRAILLAKAHGYDGINLCLSGACDFHALSDFVLKLKKTLFDYGLILFVELDENRGVKIDDAFDGAILSYSRLGMENPVSFDEGEKCVFTDYSERCEASKAYIELCPFAVSGEEIITYHEAMKICQNTAREIFYDEKTKTCYFDCVKFTPKEKKELRVCFESLENVKAKLELIQELGFMGISFDIMRTPLSHLLMFDACFRQGACINLLC
jgi:spore germination protein